MRLTKGILRRLVKEEIDGTKKKISKQPMKWIKAYRAEDSGRGIMSDALQGGIYFFPKRETVDLWAGEHGRVIERYVRIDTASIQSVPEGELVQYDYDVIVRTDPEGTGEALEIVVFNKDFIKT